MAQHSGKEEQAEEQLHDDEDVLARAARPRKVADGGQRQRAPVVTLQVLLHNVRVLAVAVHPVLATEAVVLVDDVVQTAVPVENDEQVVDEAGGTEQVGVVGVSFGAVHECPEAVDFDQAEWTQDRVEADGQVEEVQRQQAQAVDVEGRRVHIVMSQLGRVGLQHSVLEVAGTKVEHDVREVQEVGQVVQAEPHHDGLTCNPGRISTDALTTENISRSKFSFK